MEGSISAIRLFTGMIFSVDRGGSRQGHRRRSLPADETLRPHGQVNLGIHSAPGFLELCPMGRTLPDSGPGLAAALGNPIAELPVAVRELGGVFLDRIAELNEKIKEFEGQFHASTRADEEARRLMSISGIESVCASALQAFATPL